MKAINNSIIVILAAIIINLSACSPVLYSTVGQNVPLFTKKGEASFNAGIASSGNSSVSGASGFNAQLAIAVDSSLAIISSLYSLKEEGDWDGKGNYFELGIGKFKYDAKSKFTGEIFIGSGFGHIKNMFEGRQQVNANFLKVFIQPSGGFSSKVIDIAFTPRVGVVNYLSYTNDSNDQEINRFFSDKKTTVVFEPGVTVRLGFKNVKLQYQFNYSTFKYNSNSDFDPSYNKFGSLNLFFLFSDRWDKVK